MKKKLHHLIAAVLISSSVQLYAQLEGKRIPFKPGKNYLQEKMNASGKARTTTCGTDTLVYPYLKELVFMAPNDTFNIDAMVGNVRTASQAYILNSAVNVVGVQFWGGAYSTSNASQTLAVRAYLYAVDGAYKPTAVLDSATVTVTNNYDYYEAIFTAPHTVATNFAVGVKSIPNDTLAVIINNAGAAWHNPAYGEQLGWRRFGSGTWNSTLSFFGQDVEYMIFPIVNYSLSSSYTASNDTVCPGDTITFTNTSPSAALLNNRMVNLSAFDAFWKFAAADSSIKWNYGDTTAWNHSSNGNGSHAYKAAGTYTVKLVSNLLGYYSSCTDTASMGIRVNPEYSIKTAARICNGESYIFGKQTLTAPGTYTETFTSPTICDSTVVLTLDVDTVNVSTTTSMDSLTANATGATYQWIDCNNGNAIISGEMSRSFYPSASGSYAVIVKQGKCQDTSACIPYISTGISTNVKAFNVTAFPNPVNHQLTIQSNGLIPEQIVIKNMLGETVMEIHPTTATTIIETGNFASSIYFVQVSGKGYSKTLRVAKK